MAITVSGMIGSDKTFFSASPVVVDVSVTGWGQNSIFTILRLEVIFDGRVVGSFKADTGGQVSVGFDISTALRVIWSDYDFSGEVAKAKVTNDSYIRNARPYRVRAYSEYMDSDGELVSDSSGEISAGRCVIGGYTEWERSQITSSTQADVGHLPYTNLRYGTASTKPTDSPERVGSTSITSWVGVSADNTQGHYYRAGARMDDDGQLPHSPLVVRDSIPYTDFLFVNRRGAVETCSALTLEAMQIAVETKQYTRVERPAFKPSRSLMALGTDGRRSWTMSSGKQTREWAEWWTTEFLGGKSRRWWMKYKGSYVPVIVEPAKKGTIIYDRAKQDMESVEFTVTLALEG